MSYLWDKVRRRNADGPGAQLHGLLKSGIKDGFKKKELADWQLEVINQDKLFDAFMRANIDYKGQLCSAYSEHGYGAKVDVKADFGEMLCPGVGLSLAAKASVSAERTRYFLLLVGRQPRSLERLTTHSPICLLCLDGAATKLKVSLGAEVGIKTPKVPTSNLPECAAFTLEASATASAEVAYSGTRLFLRDPTPRFYPRWDDHWLKTDFSALIGPGGKREIKEDMLEFLDHEPGLRGLKPEKRAWTTLLKGQVSTAALEKALRKALQLLADQDAFPDAVKRTQLANKISYLLAEMRAHKDYQPGFFLGARKALTETELAAQVQAQGASGQGLSAAELSRRNSKLCFLDLWSHAPEAQASAVAKASASLSLKAPTKIGERAQTEKEIAEKKKPKAFAEIDWGVGVSSAQSVEGKAAIEGSFKYTTYRYQTYVRDDKDPSHILIATQDTVITYKQIKGTASVTAKLSATATALGTERGLEEKYEVKREKTFYNAMSYVSAIVYWSPGSAAPGRTGPIDVKAETGSGYSFGHSVLASVLVEKHQAYTSKGRVQGKFVDPDEDAAAYLGALAASLRVSTEDLIDFVRSCEPALGEAKGAVLVESCFAAPSPSQTLLVKAEIPDGDPARIRLLPDRATGSFRRAMIKSGAGGQDRSSAAHPHLQAIRLRVRKADKASDTKVKFKLGFSVLDNKVGIELTGVDRAGSEGIADLATYWFPPYHHFNDADGSSEVARFLGHEAAVPPVALLHQ